MSESWRTQWHKIPKYLPSAARPFFPRGERISVRACEDMLYRFKDRILNALSSLRVSGSSKKVILGNQFLTEADNLSTYLYENCIHPELFAQTLELIVKNADRLLEARIRKLGRYNLADANKSNAIDLFSDIGTKFERFGLLPECDQLALLERMGVISLKPAPPPIEPPAQIVPRFKLDENLVGLIGLTQLPTCYYDFERFSLKAVGLTDQETKRAAEIFLEPENLTLASGLAQTLKADGGQELTVKFHKTDEGICAEFSAKGFSAIKSASLLLVPRPTQGKLWT